MIAFDRYIATNYPIRYRHHRHSISLALIYICIAWFVSIAICLLPTLFFTGSNLFDESVNLYVVAYMMLIPMFLGYLLFGYALKTISASTATTLTLFEPLVAALFAVLLVGEQLAPIGWVGMVLIFVCLAVLSKTDRPK